MSSTTGQPRNRRYTRVSQQRKTKLRLPKNSIEHQNVDRRRNSSSASIYIQRVYTSRADFHKTMIFGGRVRVWATEWDVFHCTPSRGGRGRRAAVDIFRGLVFFFCVWWEFVFFVVFFSSNAHGLLQVRGNLASCTSLLVPGCVQGATI